MAFPFSLGSLVWLGVKNVTEACPLDTPYANVLSGKQNKKNKIKALYFGFLNSHYLLS